jgi:hypothetical protein
VAGNNLDAVSRLTAGSYILQVQLKDRANAQMLRFVKL